MKRDAKTGESTPKGAPKSIGESDYAIIRLFIARLLDRQRYSVNVIAQEIARIDQLADASVGELLRARGIACYFAGQLDNAIADLNAALTAGVSESAFVTAKLAQAYVCRGSAADVQRGIELCEKVLRTKGASKDAMWLAHQVRAAAFLAVGDTEKAAAEAREALTINGDVRSSYMVMLSEAAGRGDPATVRSTMRARGWLAQGHEATGAIGFQLLSAEKAYVSPV